MGMVHRWVMRPGLPDKLWAMGHGMPAKETRTGRNVVDGTPRSVAHDGLAPDIGLAAMVLQQTQLLMVANCQRLH